MERFAVLPFEVCTFEQIQEIRAGLTNGGLRRDCAACEFCPASKRVCPRYPETLLTALKVGEVLVWQWDSGMAWNARILKPEEHLPHTDMTSVRIFARSKNGYEELSG